MHTALILIVVAVPSALWLVQFSHERRRKQLMAIPPVDPDPDIKPKPTPTPTPTPTPK